MPCIWALFCSSALFSIPLPPAVTVFSSHLGYSKCSRHFPRTHNPGDWGLCGSPLLLSPRITNLSEDHGGGGDDFTGCRQWVAARVFLQAVIALPPCLCPLSSAVWLFFLKHYSEQSLHWLRWFNVVFGAHHNRPQLTPPNSLLPPPPTSPSGLATFLDRPAVSCFSTNHIPHLFKPHSNVTCSRKPSLIAPVRCPSSHQIHLYIHTY